ncbi:MAG: ATP-binding protein [Sporocytophaga sp.]|nr:ATP-binding protein [Sporocytophaga sp.]
MIQALEVYDLNFRQDLNLKFQSDLNLFTGKNGSSKTTVLKLIWYLNSGQFLNLFKEINFSYVKLITSEFSVAVQREFEKGSFNITINDEKPIILTDVILRDFELRRPRAIYDKLLDVQYKSRPTVFFPTFRRIEGGFSMDNSIEHRYSRRDSIKEALSELSLRLSLGNHKFVASISTDDIVSLLNVEYSNINSNINKLQKEKSDIIIKKIKNRTKDEKSILSEIQIDIETMEIQREGFLKPFTMLSELVIKIFQHKGIHLSNLTIGDVSNAISSDKLSAGEKQMLSFICYNAFTQNNTIFIDEPELSLHPDWQRTLVPTLMNQSRNNQFFMATHSPFIYSKYSDKEIMLSDDRGF